jgi:hypothetical protein
LDRHERSSVQCRARRKVIEQMVPRYRNASRAQKSRMLDAIVAVTGYTRKYAIQLFNLVMESKPRMQRQRLPHYGPEVQRARILAWTAANQICAKRLIPFLPTLVEATSAARAPPPDALMGNILHEAMEMVLLWSVTSVAEREPTSQSLSSITCYLR